MTRGQWRCTYPILIIVLLLGLNDAQPLIRHQNTSGIDFSSTAVLPPNHGACGRPGSHTSSYRVLPSERDIDNIPRATPRRLCFPMFGVPPEPDSYNCLGATFLDVQCTAAPLDT
jgi:hypothetical protein